MNTTQQQIKAAIGYAGITMAELARRLDTSPQNLNQKIKRDTLTRSDMEQIAAALGCTWRAVFAFEDGKEI